MAEANQQKVDDQIDIYNEDKEQPIKSPSPKENQNTNSSENSQAPDINLRKSLDRIHTEVDNLLAGSSSIRKENHAQKELRRRKRSSKTVTGGDETNSNTGQLQFSNATAGMLSNSHSVGTNEDEIVEIKSMASDSDDSNEESFAATLRPTSDATEVVGSSATEVLEAFEMDESARTELIKKNDPKEEIEKVEGPKDHIGKDFTPYSQLYIALLHNRWKEAEDFIKNNPEARTAVISEFSETFFHNIVESDEVDAIRLLQKYLQEVPQEVLVEKNSSGSTALFKAAIVGNIEAAKLLVAKSRELLTMENDQGLLPVHHAGISGHKDTVKYLLLETQKSSEDILTGIRGFELVKMLIQANLYDTASDLLDGNTELAREELSWRGIILEMMARKPMGFESASRLGYSQRLIYKCIPLQEELIYDCAHQKQTNDLENPNQKSQNSLTRSSPFRFFGAWRQKLHIVLWNFITRLSPDIRAIHDKKLMHKHSIKIIRKMCTGVPWSHEEASLSLKKPILAAAKLGIPEIVKEIIEAYPASITFLDRDENNALMLAILHRREEVFNLLSQFGVMKLLKGNNMNNKHNENILHLAAKYAPASEIPGAALQMQRELQWFKAVENYAHTPLQEECNNSNKTPRQLFTEEHEKLMEKGEKWMKDNAQSCTIAVSLIITIVFTAAFTAPGSNDDKGMPNFLHKLPFKIFVISDSLALFSSVTSLLMFLGILTSSYSEEDFLVSLPTKLIIGFITMFFSIASMMVAFGATIYMVLSQPWKWVIIPIVLLSGIPVTLFVRLQFPLLVQIDKYTYAPTIRQPMKNTQNLYSYGFFFFKKM